MLAAITDAVSRAVRGGDGHEPIADIPRITWHDAMDRYGSDKPDVRFGLELIELTDVFAATEFNAFKAAARQGDPRARAPRRRRAAADSTT